VPALLGMMAAAHRGAGALLAELEDTATEREVPFALLLWARLESVGPNAPRLLSEWARRDVLATALLQGWRAVAEDRAAAVQELEPQLEAVGPRHPAYTAALRLRIGWRLASGDPVRAREGLRLHQTLTATLAGLPDLMLRARLAAKARDPELVRVSLHEILPILERREGLRATAEEALGLLDSTPGGDEAARARLRERLAAAAGPQATRSRPASLAR